MILDEEAGVTQGMLLGEEAGHSSGKIDAPYRGMLLSE